MNKKTDFLALPLMSQSLFMPVLLFAVAGCATVGTDSVSLSAAERKARDFHFESLVPGAPIAALDWFTHVKARPASTPSLKIFDIYSPSPQVSLAVARFENNRLRQFDLRYYDGEGISTLTRAGKWHGLCNRLVKVFGPPTNSSPKVPVRTDQPGINPQYAVVNSEWDFPRVARRINLVAMQGDSGGVAVVTVAITGPMPPESPRHTRSHKHKALKEDPGF